MIASHHSVRIDQNGAIARKLAVLITSSPGIQLSSFLRNTDNTIGSHLKDFPIVMIDRSLLTKDAFTVIWIGSKMNDEEAETKKIGNNFLIIAC